MEVGAIGFHDERRKKYVPTVEKDRDILRALKKTEKEDKEPDFIAMREKRIQEIKKINQKIYNEQAAIKKEQDK